MESIIIGKDYIELEDVSVVGRLLIVLDGLQGEVCPLVLLLSQALRLPVVSLGVGQLGLRHRDVVQRQLLLPPVVSDDVEESPIYLDLAVHISVRVWNTNIYTARRRGS